MLAANYPFATIDPNVGVVAVPDPRLEPSRLRSTTARRSCRRSVTFVDIAGLVRGASQGEGLGNQFLAAIRETDAICQVVRAFHDDDVVHVDARVDPAGDIETVNTELILADLQTVEKRLPKLVKEAKGDARPQADRRRRRRRRSASSARAGPSRVRPAAGELDADAAARPAPAHGQAVHLRLQRRRGRAGRRRSWRRDWPRACARHASIVLCAQIEAEVAGLDPDDAQELLAQLRPGRVGLEQLVHVGFATLGLQTFLTAGPKEARAWTIHVGDTAPEGGRRDPHRLRDGASSRPR